MSLTEGIARRNSSIARLFCFEEPGACPAEERQARSGWQGQRGESINSLLVFKATTTTGDQKRSG